MPIFQSLGGTTGCIYIDGFVMELGWKGEIYVWELGGRTKGRGDNK
jgi:hypothetical protein